MANLYRVRATLTYGQGGPGLSQFYFLVTGGSANATDALAVAGRVRAAWAAFAPSLATTFAIQTQATVDVLSDISGALTGSFGITPPANVVGTGGSTSSGPAQIMCGIKWGTNGINNGRKVQGRSFLGPLSNTQTGFPVPNVTPVANAASFVTALITATPPAAVAPLVIWSRPTTKTSNDGSSASVISGQLDFGKWFTMNRRRDG